MNYPTKNTGNIGKPGKRAAFKEGKAERATLANSVNAAFERRKPVSPKHDATLESVEEYVKAKKFKR
jgi:hypothetical protein